MPTQCLFTLSAHHAHFVANPMSRKWDLTVMVGKARRLVGMSRAKARN